ncbi:helicase-related protein, partial [Streptomyces sp. NPDC003952]
SVDPSQGAVTTMEHHVLHVQNFDKQAATTEIAAREGRVIMFLDTKHGVDRLTEHLLSNGVRAAALHGGKSQPQRTRTLTQFKSGHVTVLVATNVAARGIHVDNLDLVVNVDPPTDPKDYLHRGGRTARAGESGSVVTLVTPNQRRDMTRLMQAAGISPETTQVHSGDEVLNRITGAQAPSGIPVTITAPVVERAKRSTASRGRRGPASAARRASARQSAFDAAA